MFYKYNYSSSLTLLIVRSFDVSILPCAGINQTAICLLCDVVHRYYKGVLYCNTVLWNVWPTLRIAYRSIPICTQTGQ